MKLRCGGVFAFREMGQWDMCDLYALWDVYALAGRMGPVREDRVH